MFFLDYANPICALRISFISLYYTKLVPTVITNKDTKSVNI